MLDKEFTFLIIRIIIIVMLVFVQIEYSSIVTEFLEKVVSKTVSEIVKQLSEEVAEKIMKFRGITKRKVSTEVYNVAKEKIINEVKRKTHSLSKYILDGISSNTFKIVAWVMCLIIQYGMSMVNQANEKLFNSAVEAIAVVMGKLK
jgi:hypothetical protein